MNVLCIIYYRVPVELGTNNMGLWYLEMCLNVGLSGRTPSADRCARRETDVISRLFL